MGARTRIWLSAALVAGVLTAPGPAGAASFPEPFGEVTLADGLTQPVAVDWAPDGRMFVAEKPGRVRVVSADGELLPSPLIDISDHVNRSLDRGLLGIAVDAGFEDNGYLYLLYVYEPNPLLVSDGGPRTSRLTRIVLNDDGSLANPGDPETVLLGSVTTSPCPDPLDTVDCIPAEDVGHMVGTVRADPDGTLWVGSGDASPNFFHPRAFRTYDERSFAGKILHVDRDGKGLPGHPFCPADDDLTHVCTKVHARGFRNPFRFSLRPGAPPLAADVGLRAQDELDVVQPGANYGWPCYEGTTRTPNYRDSSECQAEYAKEGTPEAARGPIHTVPAGALIGAPQYPGGDYPDDFDGDVFVADYTRGWLRRLDLGAGDQVLGSQPMSSDLSAVDLRLAPNGDLVYVDFGTGAGADGAVRRIEYGPSAPTAVATASPDHGELPLEVQFDASASSDPDGDPLEYEWDFGDSSPSSDEPDPVHTYGGDQNYTARLRVTDSEGRSDEDTVVVYAGDLPPEVKLSEPSATASFRAGDPVALSGTATDPEDGAITGAGLSWHVVLHHGDHQHVVADAAGGSAAFTTLDDHDADSHYEVTLSATDSRGLRVSRSVEIRPRVSGVTLQSEPPGAAIDYAGRSLLAPASFGSAAGFRATVSAAASFVRDGRTYEFRRWSDGGERLHVVRIPDTGLSLTASYAELLPPVEAPPPASPPAPEPGERRDARGSVRVLSRRGLDAPKGLLRGRVSDADGVASLRVALRAERTGSAARSKRRCRWWSRRLGRLRGRAARCDRPVWMRARLSRRSADSASWSLRLGGPVRAGRYLLAFKLADGAGNATVTPARRGRAAVRLTVRGR